MSLIANSVLRPDEEATPFSSRSAPLGCHGSTPRAYIYFPVISGRGTESPDSSSLTIGPPLSSAKVPQAQPVQQETACGLEASAQLPVSPQSHRTVSWKVLLSAGPSTSLHLLFLSVPWSCVPSPAHPYPPQVTLNYYM